MLLKKLFLIIFVLSSSVVATECSPYFNPDRFYKAPEYLTTLLKNKVINNGQEFTIEKKELYRYSPIDIATEINENFQDSYGVGGYWRDWNEDAYEMVLIPEQTLFKYNKSYFSLQIVIEGVVGDATTLKGTIVKYNFYNYTKQVNEHIQCKKGKN